MFLAPKYLLITSTAPTSAISVEMPARKLLLYSSYKLLCEIYDGITFIKIFSFLSDKYFAFFFKPWQQKNVLIKKWSLCLQRATKRTESEFYRVIKYTLISKIRNLQLNLVRIRSQFISLLKLEILWKNSFLLMIASKE